MGKRCLDKGADKGTDSGAGQARDMVRNVTGRADGTPAHAAAAARRTAPLLLTLVVLLTPPFLLTGCGQKQEDDYIGINAAKEAAFKDAGVAAADATVSTAGLDKKDGLFFYQVDFSADGTEYQYAVDAVTGVVIEAAVSGDAAAESSHAAASGDAAAESSHAAENNGTAAAGSPIPGTGTPEGSISDPGDPTESSGTATDSGTSIDSSAAALAAAYAHAGLSENEIFFQEVKLDHDHGRDIYEVEFISADGTEYEYEIDAADGSILSFSHDSESSLEQLPDSSQAGIIPVEQAKQSVLDRVPGADETNLSIRLREDDGRQEYKGELFYDQMLYEFKIDAYSGMFVEWEAETVE